MKAEKTHIFHSLKELSFSERGTQNIMMGNEELNNTDLPKQRGFHHRFSELNINSGGALKRVITMSQQILMHQIFVRIPSHHSGWFAANPDPSAGTEGM